MGGNSNHVDKFFDSLDIEGEPKYYMVVKLDFVQDVERIVKFLETWDDGLVEPFAMAEGNIEWRWAKTDGYEGIEKKMSDIIETAMVTIAEDFNGRHDELSNEEMTAELMSILNEYYTTGADSYQAWPMEEIAEAIGELPIAVEYYFDNLFDIKNWHNKDGE